MQPPPPSSRRGRAAIYIAATFTSAFLVFLVQPMLGRFVLPWFGGGPSVWTLCLLFFQLGLLAGYAYAHLLVARLPARRGVALHLALVGLSLLTMPVTPSAPSGSGHVLGVLGVLAGSVGLPYVLLSATAPLLQAWATRAEPEAGGPGPWRLYAWSNAGSLLALLAYPVLFEPWLGRTAQTIAWSAAYALLALLLALAARAVWQAADRPAEPASGPRPSLGDRALWVALSACGSIYLIAVTDTLTEDVGAAPFLWVVPLALYLATFILAFGRPGWTRRILVLPPLLLYLPLQGWALFEASGLGIGAQLFFQGAGLFAGCLALHGELVRLRPAPAHLTSFYLATAAGGALGGLLVGVVAPLVFPIRVEAQIAMLGVATLPVFVFWRERRRVEWRTEPAWVWLLGLMPAGFLAWTLWGHVEMQLGYSIWVKRNFFGVLQVKEVDASTVGGPSRRLLHGRIAHGRQYTDERRREPISYYGRQSGAGLAIDRRPDGPPRHLAVVGLGVGTLAAFGRSGDRVTFYEINPEVVTAARELFTYLSDSPAQITVVEGDARLRLAESSDRYDVLALDAFSSDAIPAHLLTREALALYLERLTPDGVLALNISNRHVDLRPVVTAHAAHFGLEVATITSDGSERKGLHRARWMLVTRDPTLRPWLAERKAEDPPQAIAPVEWTDESTPLLPLLRALR